MSDSVNELVIIGGVDNRSLPYTELVGRYVAYNAYQIPNSTHHIFAQNNTEGKGTVCRYDLRPP